MRGVALTAGLFFLLTPAGIASYLQFHAPPGLLHWVAWSISAGFVILGGLVVVWSIGSICWPAYVCHAAPDLLPDVPDEPVVFDGAIVQSWRIQELVEDAAGWEFRPVPSLRNSPLWFLVFFGTPFLAICSGLASWAFDQQANAPSWPFCFLLGTTITLLCGGSALSVMVWMILAAHRRLARLMIPRNGDPLELDLAELPDPTKTDVASGFKWMFDGDKKRKRLTIPRELLRAVQLCPWKFVMGKRDSTDTTWAVQGLLVLQGSSASPYSRLPFVLSGDLAGTARLMQQIAETLRVPYLFSADAKGWKAETLRAATRPPLKIGGMM